jgi:hypothetical protein
VVSVEEVMASISEETIDEAAEAVLEGEERSELLALLSNQKCWIATEIYVTRVMAFQEYKLCVLMRNTDCKCEN